MLIYEYPLCLTASIVSNNSRTDTLDLIFGECTDPLGFNEEDCQGCYCQPYIMSDKFVYQIRNNVFEDEGVTSLDIYSVENVFIANVPIFESTSYLTEQGAFTNILFNMSELNILAETGCFKVQVTFSDSTYMSEPFCLISLDTNCDSCEEPTLLFCSEYNYMDCNNTIYSSKVFHNASSFPTFEYSNCMRLKAVLERKTIAEENTYDEINTSLSTRIVHTKSKTIDQYELRIWGIPEWQVDRIKAVLAGKNLNITATNGRVYRLQVKSGFEKGNDKGTLWFPVVKLEKSCEIINKNC